MTKKRKLIDLTPEEILNGSTIEDLLSEGEMHMDDLPICEPEYERAERIAQEQRYVDEHRAKNIVDIPF